MGSVWSFKKKPFGAFRFHIIEKGTCLHWSLYVFIFKTGQHEKAPEITRSTIGNALSTHCKG